jgi:RNA polymerase sigma factor (TIGR02999 family)
MTSDPQGEVTRLLGEIEAGNASAQERLLEVAYGELRALAGGLMRQERAGHTLQPTALVHEAAVRLLGEGALARVQGRRHFFGAMATAMRRVLVDHARARRADRRGGGRPALPLDEALDQLEQSQRIDLLGLDDALRELAARNPRQAEVVVLRFFGGLEMDEIAGHLGVSLSTVEKDWRVARAWLRSVLADA